VRLEPDEQHIWFLHNGRLFRFQRSKVRAPIGFVVSQTITLTVLGFRVQSIVDLIAEMQDQWFSGSKHKTTIMRPLPKEVRDRGGYPWTVIAQRPSRSIDTAISGAGAPRYGTQVMGSPTDVRDVLYVRALIVLAQINMHRPSYINGILIQSQGFIQDPPCAA
jgi:BCS1 N terminal